MKRDIHYKLLQTEGYQVELFVLKLLSWLKLSRKEQHKCYKHIFHVLSLVNIKSVMLVKN